MAKKCEPGFNPVVGTVYVLVTESPEIMLIAFAFPTPGSVSKKYSAETIVPCENPYRDDNNRNIIKFNLRFIAIFF